METIGCIKENKREIYCTSRRLLNFIFLIVTSLKYDINKYGALQLVSARSTAGTDSNWTLFINESNPIWSFVVL